MAVRHPPQAQPAASLPVGGPAGGARLWLASAIVVAGLHAGAVAAVVLWQPAAAPVFPSPGAMMIELAPPAQPPAAPRPPEQAAPEQPKPPPPKKAEVALPKPKPKPKAEPPPPDPAAQPAEKAVVSEAPPVPADLPVARTAVPPAPVAAAPPSGDAVPTWQGALRAHLERHKRYPSAAQFRRQQGAPTVRFVMDREGKVLSAQLERGCGHSALDEEALALLERAQPLPAPPPEVAGERIEMRVPIQFYLR